MKANVAALEGLRGLAALLVVLYHARLSAQFLDFTAGGYLAVDLFFVLSGFVIASAYGRTLSDEAGFRVFMVRRFGRIWPTMLAAFVLYYVFANAAVACFKAAGMQVAVILPPAIDVLTTIALLQGIGLTNHYVEPVVVWSASAEFYVYVLFGLLCLWTRGTRRVAAFAALALAGYCVTVWASLAVHGCLAKGECAASSYGFGWARCLTGFFGGALVAEFKDARTFRALRGPVMQVTTFVVAVAFVLAAPHVAPLAFAAPIVFVALIAALVNDSGPMAALLNGRTCQYLGSVSYPLYLAHAVLLPLFLTLPLKALSPTIQAAACAVYLLLSFTLAILLRNWIELPYRTRFQQWSLRFRQDTPPQAAVN